MGTHEELIQAVDDIGLNFSFSSCIGKMVGNNRTY